jgi:hypothetical protein
VSSALADQRGFGPGMADDPDLPPCSLLLRMHAHEATFRFSSRRPTVRRALRYAMPLLIKRRNLFLLRQPGRLPSFISPAGAELASSRKITCSQCNP